MKTVISIISILIILILLTAVLWGGYVLVGYTYTAFISLDPQIASLLSVIVIIVLLVSLVFSRVIRNNLKYRRTVTLTSYKSDLYQSFISFYNGYFNSGNNSVQNQETIQERFYEFNHQLTLFSSPSVLKTYISLHKIFSQKENDPLAIQKLYIKVISEMRKDIGSGFVAAGREDFGKLLFRFPTITEGEEKTTSKKQPHNLPLPVGEET